jgi:polyisoprenoid-binding protein YceI
MSSLSAVIHVGPVGQPVSIRAELDARGIDTGNRRRDKDLRGHRFLATDQWPAITFEAHYIQPNETGWTISGTLTVKGAHCPVRLQVAGPATPARADRADLHATGRIDRRSAGVTAGPGFLIGHRISFSLGVRLLPPAGPPRD